MKRVIFFSLTLAIMACNSKSKTETTETDASVNTDTVATAVSNETKTIDESSELYGCSMHPEIQGKKGEKCPKCGMDLTEPVMQ